ncbi:MAG TPA: hypothetical protein VEZ90_03530 [Blastocatellia bacterium]|nr:hypothetical protein [Blastocatellia bacterium]
MDFIYDKEPAADGTPVTKTIVLPPGLTVDSTKNVLVYTVNKGTQTSTLELAGTIKVHSNFALTYVLDSQDDAGIQSTTFSIAADLKSDSVGEGHLQLTVQRTDGQQTIQIGGFYHGVVAGTALQVGFTYTRTVSNQKTTDVVGFNGSVSVGATTVTWNTQVSAGQISIDITAHVAITSTTCIDAALNFTRSGQQVAITAMFGISTGCGKAQPNLDALVFKPSASPLGAREQKRILLAAARSSKG